MSNSPNDTYGPALGDALAETCNLARLLVGKLSTRAMTAGPNEMTREEIGDAVEQTVELIKTLAKAMHDVHEYELSKNALEGEKPSESKGEPRQKPAAERRLLTS